MAESRIGWIPFFISWMDHQVHVRETDSTMALNLLPGEYVKRNVRFTFENDRIGGQRLAHEWSGLQDIVLWDCDYPHPQEVWPDPTPLLDQIFSGIDPELNHEIVFGRAEKLFGIDTTAMRAMRTMRTMPTMPTMPTTGSGIAPE